MIEMVIEPLENSKQKELKLWLSQKEADQLRECVLAVIHDCTSNAMNAILAGSGVRTANEIPQGAAISLAEASEWKVFLNKLNLISEPDFQFTNIQSTKYHARPD